MLSIVLLLVHYKKSTLSRNNYTIPELKGSIKTGEFMLSVAVKKA
jgi:hypothetical protein